MKFEDLSFVGKETSGDETRVLPWAPKRTGDYIKDCKLGRQYFAELFDLVNETNNPTYLTRVMADQVRGGVWEGVEIGFSAALADLL